MEQALIRATEVRARVGRTIAGKWRLLRALGVGATAGVYEAIGPQGRRVAVKVLHERFSGDEALKKRFLQEAVLANTIDHPGIVRVFEADIDTTGNVYLVLELLQGDTLETLRQRCGGTLAPQLVEELARQVLQILAAAHANGVVHRDIKPANLFLDDGGGVRILDFGIARSAELSGQSTATGALLGTPAFMAPEQARGRTDLVDTRTDLWGLGATLFTLLTGRHVHVAATPNEQFGLAMTSSAPPISRFCKDLPAGLQRAIDTALAYERDHRWLNAEAMLACLDAAEPPIAAPSSATTTASFAEVAPGPRERRSGARFGSWWAIGGLVLVLLAGLATTGWRMRSDAPRVPVAALPLGEAGALPSHLSAPPWGTVPKPPEVAPTAVAQAHPADVAAAHASRVLADAGASTTPGTATGAIAGTHPTAAEEGRWRPPPARTPASSARPPSAEVSEPRELHADDEQILRRRH